MAPELNIEVVPLAEVPFDNSVLTPQKRRRTVLVVDDERVIADTLSVILSRSGFSVLTAYNGETALELAHKVTPDLVLSDVMLGLGIDGIRLAIQVVRENPDCKVLLFSGSAATADLLAGARNLGHNFTLLAKPVHPADLLTRIAESFTRPDAPEGN
jgi:CheY-like chemotaxis protein